MFHSTKNKELLWDIMSRTHYFQHLRENQLSDVKHIFETTMQHTSLLIHKNKNITLIDLNKQFLIDVDQQLLSYKNSIQSPTNSKSTNIMKSDHTNDLILKMNQKKDELIEIMNPQPPPQIDFTNVDTEHFSLYKNSVAKTPEFSQIDSSTIDELLQQKIQARDSELSIYLENMHMHDQNNPNSSSSSNPNQAIPIKPITDTDYSHVDPMPILKIEEKPIEPSESKSLMSDTIVHVKKVKFNDTPSPNHNHHHHNKVIVPPFTPTSDPSDATILESILVQQKETNAILHKQTEILLQLINKIE